MADMEKVVKGLAHCTRPTEVGKGGNFCTDCPYTEAIWFNRFKCNGKQMMKDALELLKDYERLKEQHKSLVETCDELLKDQEPVEPMATITANGIHHDFCGKCGRLLPIGQAKYCSYCGQAVKWE